LKGIVLAGGSGKRLAPLTTVASKQLLPIYNKPLIYYSISTLMLAGIRDILIIIAPDQKDKFLALLSDGKQFGLQLRYAIQERPAGLAESMIISEDFLNGERSCLILGDNIFHGPGLGRALSLNANVLGAHIFGYTVKNPTPYGIATLDDEMSVIKLEEKPIQSESHIAIPGLYFFDSKASGFAKEIKPSLRGELEILDLLEIYRKRDELELEMLPRGTAWFDSGTFSDMHDASTYVRLMEERTGNRVGDPNEIASLQGWVR